MRSEQQVEAAAAAAAEKANGGKFSDPLFYKPEHRKFWLDVMRAGLDAAEAVRPAQKEALPKVSQQEVKDFSGHCVLVRSVYTFMVRIFRDSDASERKTMEALAPLLFEDLSNVLADFVIIAACRITDPAKDARGNENFTAELFVNSFAEDSKARAELHTLLQGMMIFRKKILPARNKLGSHTDRATVLKGEPIGAASWKEWDGFWTELATFVRVLNEKTFGKPFEIDAGGVRGDAEMFLKALKHSEHFEQLLKDGDAAVKEACLAVALPKA